MLILIALLGCKDKDLDTGYDPDPPFGTELARVELPPAAGLWVDAARAYACTGAEGVYVLDVSEPNEPYLEDVVGVDCLAIDGESGRVHVAAGDYGMRVIHPGNLALIGGYEPDFAVHALTVDAGEYQAWIAGPVTETGALGVEGVLTYSVDNLAPNKRADLDAGDALAIAYDREAVFVARDDDTVALLGLVMDLRSTITLPGPLGGGAGGGLLAQEGVLWTALGSAGLVAWDVGDQWAPAQLSAWSQDSAWGLAAIGDRLYVGADQALVVLDIADPSAPTEVNRVALDGIQRPEGVYVLDAKAWITDAQDGAFVVVSVDEDAAG